MHSRFRFAHAVAAATLLVGCDTPTDPLARIAVSLESSALTVAPGDSVRFVVTLSNPSASTLLPGQGCGPPVDVQLSNASTRFSILDGLTFTCERPDSYYLKPFETRGFVLYWIAPPRPGTYQLQASVRRVTAPLPVSAPRPFTIR